MYAYFANMCECSFSIWCLPKQLRKKMIIYAWLAKRIGLGGDNSNNHSFYTIHIFMFMNEDGGIIIIGCLMW